jgi:alpha-amylase/alpha-mannosidase (GH57 family)
MRHPRYLCIHGHFYQPPRENPWLDVVEVQDSAAPHHDWNERITRECYAPNTRSRLLDAQGRICDLVNNYTWISFNFGPTLLSWMADHAPATLRQILEADRLSRERRGGHGNALAQVYNHMILPLASERDRRTQVLWGIAEFRHRFGREPEGMWLAETAVDTPSLEALAEAGIAFTVLAPGQARRWRKVGSESWVEVPGAIDPSRAYRAILPSGRTIALFFYDGNVSRQVAFERLLDDGERFRGRLLKGFDDARDHPQLMHIATDGESYGHHHPHGDMALAYALRRLAQDPEIRLTNYGEFLERHPPEWEVEIHEKSAWSCAHGVGRWNADCGCRMRGDWHQKWRAPLREAFDGLKTQLDHLFSTRGRECFPDPWAARDAYIAVVLERSPRAVHQFFRRHGHPDLDVEQMRDGLRLLELQRDGMLMYTSCGWFFDEISGIETTQCLHYAARALHLARHFGRDFERKFLQVLKKAPSNIPRFRDGKGVWEQLVRPATVDIDRVLAHSAISLIYPPMDPATRSYPFDIEVLDQDVRSRGTSRLAVGRLRARSHRTWDEAEATFVVIHYGGLDFHTVLRLASSHKEYEAIRKRLVDAYHTGSLADVTAMLAREFEGRVHRLDDLFVDEQRRIITLVLQDRIADYQRTFERLVRQDDDVFLRLGQLRHPIPKPLRAAASSHLDVLLREEIERLETGGGLDPVRALFERGRAWGYQPESDVARKVLTDALRRTLAGLDPSADLSALVARAGLILEAATVLGVSADLWDAQNELLDAHARLAESGTLNAALQAIFEDLAVKLNLSPGLLGWKA